MEKRGKIIQTLKECAETLRNALVDIKAENTEDTQFDYVSHPRLSAEVDSLRTIILEIDAIVYQDGDDEN